MTTERKPDDKFVWKDGDVEVVKQGEQPKTKPPIKPTVTWPAK